MRHSERVRGGRDHAHQHLCCIQRQRREGVAHHEVCRLDEAAQALADADELINSYLGERYTLPLPEVPRMVVSVACDIARHRLHKEGLHEEVRKRYEDALRWLKDVAAGRSGLGLPEGSEPVSRSGIRSGQAKSNFDWDRH